MQALYTDNDSGAGLSYRVGRTVVTFCDEGEVNSYAEVLLLKKADAQL